MGSAKSCEMNRANEAAVHKTRGSQRDREAAKEGQPVEGEQPEQAKHDGHSPGRK